MYDQIRQDTLFIILYSVVTAMAAMASCYLLFRRANGIAPDITTPVRLRRWGAAFLASIALSHAWYMPVFFLTSNDDITMCDLVGGLFDTMTFFPLAIVVLLTMLQDRRRPLWPVAAMMAPIVAGGVFGVAARSYAFLPIAYVYFLLMCIGIIIYMVRATKQYGRWLRDNFADLEHKEVWQSHVVMAVILLVFAIYVFTSKGPVYQYAMQVIYVILICYLLWRVETLSDLSIHVSDTAEEIFTTDNVEDNDLPLSICNSIELLLQQHCIDNQLYLQHNLNLLKLAKAIGTNRTYLGQYFSSHGTNYNTYINDLRVNHFISCYQEAITAGQPAGAQQLALESGFSSYRTFSDAFKRKMGQSVTAWIKEDKAQR
jgi:AraC-like DNA-binding protein